MVCYVDHSNCLTTNDDGESLSFQTGRHPVHGAVCPPSAQCRTRHRSHLGMDWRSWKRRSPSYSWTAHGSNVLQHAGGGEQIFCLLIPTYINMINIVLLIKSFINIWSKYRGKWNLYGLWYWCIVFCPTHLKRCCFF